MAGIFVDPFFGWRLAGSRLKLVGRAGVHVASDGWLS